MSRWELKYQLTRAGRWAGRKLLTAGLLLVILAIVGFFAWLIQYLNLQFGVDATIYSFAVIVVCVWFVILDHAIWD